MADVNYPVNTPDAPCRIRRSVNCASDGVLSLQSTTDANAAAKPAWSSR